VPVFLGANVQSSPLALPVKGQAVLGLVGLPCLVELVKVNVAGAPLVEEAEDDLVLGVGLCQQVLEDGPVVDIDLALLVAVGDLEEDAILISLDLVLEAGAPLAGLDTRLQGTAAYVVFAFRRNGRDELVLVEVVLARLVLLGVLHKGGARELRQLGLLGAAEKHLAHFFLDGRHSERMTLVRGSASAIGLERSRRGR
jgi:hypothetical protein